MSWPTLRSIPSAASPSSTKRAISPSSNACSPKKGCSTGSSTAAMPQPHPSAATPSSSPTTTAPSKPTPSRASSTCVPTPPKAEDTIQRWHGARKLQTSRIELASWDYRSVSARPVSMAVRWQRAATRTERRRPPRPLRLRRRPRRRTLWRRSTCKRWPRATRPTAAKAPFAPWPPAPPSPSAATPSTTVTGRPRATKPPASPCCRSNTRPGTT